MIREHFCNYENSLELRELGFDGECFTFYEGNTLYLEEDFAEQWLYCTNKDTFINSPNPTAPLLSQAIEWLEKNHNLILTVDWYSFNSTWRYCIEMKDTSSFNFYVTEEAGFLNWNAAAQEGITSAISYLKNSIG